ncbi:MAG: hypothetical protein JWM87_4688 [Candidatus Eremiobacteraeota bacterium]|nr:hypothetical protein [Candidatus Eremiobacteraeota bacterium]
MIGPGIFLIVQRETGTRAVATVGDCQVLGTGKHERTHCNGTWVVGGSLLAGGHVAYGTINGARKDDVGKKLDVTLRGDSAYTRDLKLPAILIGLGLVLLGLLVRRMTMR